MSDSESARRSAAPSRCCINWFKIAKAVKLNGRPAIEDNDIRQQLAQFAIEATAKKYNGLRSLSKRLKGLQPGPGSFDQQLVSTDLRNG